MGLTMDNDVEERLRNLERLVANMGELILLQHGEIERQKTELSRRSHKIRCAPKPRSACFRVM